MDLVKAQKCADELYESFPTYHDTCSYFKQRDNCFCYYTGDNPPVVYCNTILLHKAAYDDPFLVFALLHNRIHEAKWRRLQNSEYLEGLRYARADCGTLIPLKHIGTVQIGENVDIGPNTTIHRAVFDLTEIKSGVKIGSNVNIGHGVVVNENTIIASGAVVGGSAYIGANCFIGMGAIIRNGVHIARSTMVGQGTNVVKSIKDPGGVWYGNPACWVRKWDGDWS